MAGRTIAIGDIHGCRGKLSKILTHLQLNVQDKLIFLGDYIDRGPDSAGVISDLIWLSQTVSCVFLRGNHEDMLLRTLREEPNMVHLFVENGGNATMASYDCWPIPDAHQMFLENTRLYHKEKDTLFVHAGLNPTNGPLENQDEHDLLWIRNDYLQNPEHPWPFRIVSGHTPHKEPSVSADGNRIVIDTGAVYGKNGYGSLCAFDVTNEKFVILMHDGVVLERECCPQGTECMMVR